MTTLGDFHNPDNLTDAQIGTAEGWRLLRVGEGILSSDEFWSGRCEWARTCYGGDVMRSESRATRRTRRPDPLKAEPRPVESKWVRFTDAMPTGPFYVANADGVNRFAVFHARPGQDLDTWAGSQWTHWHPAPPLPEPPREGTQREKDERRLIEWWRGLSIDFAHDHLASDDAVNAWHAALAWERAEVAKLLPGPDCFDVKGKPLYAGVVANGTVKLPAIDAIRARVGGGR